jgi:penicillin-insensitive murein endopeptidase
MQAVVYNNAELYWGKTVMALPEPYVGRAAAPTGCRTKLGPVTALAVVLAAATLPALGAETPWSRIQHASLGEPAAIGGPSNGCIDGAEALPSTGLGFVSIRRHRNRYYGHPETIRLVRDLGRAMHERNGRYIMIGDLAQPRGGRMSSSHISHQNGLDVDIWLALADSPAEAVRTTPEHRDPPSMLTPKKLNLNERFGPDQLFLIQSAAQSPAVDRILVNPGIKRALCRQENDAKWLRKLRPWWGHDAHMHIRLKCPPGSRHCKQQSPVPMGSGCGSELAWWFSLEARTPSSSSSSKPRARPQPPAQCQVLLRAS